MACAWCKGGIPGELRRDAVFCSKRCRQAAFRLRVRSVELEARGERAASPMRMAYADPPYPGLAHRYYGGEASYAGEVDHVALLERLSHFDGWALSTGGYALRDLLPLCPEGARVCPWVKLVHPSSSTYGPHGAWEPLIVVPGRRLRPGKRDWVAAAPARLGGSKLPGRKPLKFVAWMFELLGLLPGDELEDLYPGSGVVSAAWREVCRSRPAQALGDASCPACARRVAEDLRGTRRPAPARDASRVGRRRRVPLGVVAEAP